MAKTVTNSWRAGRRQSRRAAGFTLIELMVSMALVLLLIFGVHHVFRLTSNTVNAGQAYSAANRDNLTAHANFYNDLYYAVTGPDAPCFIIDSGRVGAFRDAADEAGDQDYLRTETDHKKVDDSILTFDLNADNKEDAGEGVRRGIYNFRNHRTDIVTFFARNLYRRQTGNDGTYASDMTSNEAWVWYGHMKQPKPTADMNADNALAGSLNPGWRPLNPANTAAPETAATNPNNFYSRQWILARVVTLLSKPDKNEKIFDRSGKVEQRYIKRKSKSNLVETNADNHTLAPLNQGSQVDNDKSPLIQWSRYDLAGTTISDYREEVLAYRGKSPYYDELSYRFAGFPFPTKPHTSAGLARVVPGFVSGCTQFIVEYAGDYVNQDVAHFNEYGEVVNGPHPTGPPLIDEADRRHKDWGKVVGVGPDGAIDVFVDTGDSDDSKDEKWNVSRVEKVRWYGFPRDVNGDGRIYGWKSGRTNNEMPDVVPLRDVIRTIGGEFEKSNGAAFERGLLPTNPPNGTPSQLPARTNYAAPGDDGVGVNDRYVCAWGPDIDPTLNPMPRMLRITAVFDDPEGRMTDGLSFEYVIELPYQPPVGSP